MLSSNNDELEIGMKQIQTAFFFIETRVKLDSWLNLSANLRIRVKGHLSGNLR